MRKLAAFMPAIVFSIMYGLAAVVGEIGMISPVAAVWIALLWLAGILLTKHIWWGGLFGIIPGACFIYMGTQETGQIIKETFLGVIILLYYAVCIYFICKKSSAKYK